MSEDLNNWEDIAVRMADEGIPIAAIARSVGAKSADVRTVVEEAVQRGHSSAVPRHDWVPTSSRDNRVNCVPKVSISDPILVPQIMRVYGLTGAEATMFSVLLRRAEVVRETLHTAIKKIGAGKETGIKIVDVFICKMREKLKRHGIFIFTIWGKGYFLDPDGRKLVFERLDLPASEGPEAGAVAQVVADAGVPSGGVVRHPSKAA